MRIRTLTLFVAIAVLSLITVNCTVVNKDSSTNAQTKKNPFPEKWINGENCTTEPKAQVHQFNPDFFIIRQSVCTNFEAPFIYLIFGQQKVLMQDTGASDFGQRQLVDKIIEEWLERNNKQRIELIVSHSHGHGDHVAGDDYFRGRENTQIIESDVQSVKDFFDLQDWPEGIAQLDLGDRLIDVIPIPGHQDAHIALYDYQTRILFTGDSLYPGRLYFKQSTFKQYQASMTKLLEYTRANNVSYVLGTHIEMTNKPGVDYEFDAKTHRNERRLQLNAEHLKELVDSFQPRQGRAKVQVHDDFILYPTD